MRLRHGSAAAAVVLALAAPAAAHAQGAGDDEYSDPFGSDQATPTATPRARSAPAAPAAPAPAQPPPTAAPAPAQPPPTAPAAAAGSQPAAGAAPPTLPYTGADAWLPGLGGALLLGTGLALRLRLREPD